MLMDVHPYSEPLSELRESKPKARSKERRLAAATATLELMLLGQLAGLWKQNPLLG